MSTNRLRRLSGALGFLCLSLALLLPAGTLAAWLLSSPAELLARGGILVPAGLEQAAWQRSAGAALALVPALLMAGGLVQARRCFAAVAAGAYFGTGVIRGLKGFGGMVALAVLVSILVKPLLGVMMTWHVPGGRQLAVGVSSDQLLGLLVAGLLWVIAAIVARAAELADENASFV